MLGRQNKSVYQGEMWFQKKKYFLPGKIFLLGPTGMFLGMENKTKQLARLFKTVFEESKERNKNHKGQKEKWFSSSSSDTCCSPTLHNFILKISRIHALFAGATMDFGSFSKCSSSTSFALYHRKQNI